MEDKRFTPGPWEVVDDDHHELGTDSSVLIESTSRGITLAIIGPEDSTTYTEDMVNAQLIASAPELFEALQLSLAAMNEMGDILNFHDMADSETVEKLTPAFEMARAAINKALGKEHQ
ncbi:TPA: hypothetical protein I8621_002701 [Citrobacter freundii]|nr:hypothetical protein [Citrobacter freundii]